MGDTYKGKDSAPAINMKKQSSVPPELGPQWNDQQRAQMQQRATRVIESMGRRGVLPEADLYKEMLGLR